MKFDHRVKFNGILYEIGQDVPMEEKKDIGNENAKPQEVVGIEGAVEIVKTKEFSYTKTEINRMSTADLKKLAKENGIDESLSGAEIKKTLIEKFGL